MIPAVVAFAAGGPVINGYAARPDSVSSRAVAPPARVAPSSQPSGLGRVAVRAVTPGAGPVAGGTVVTIRGIGFTHVTGVRFGTENATFSVADSGQLYASSPAASIAGTVDITVVTGGGMSARARSDQFTYLVLFGPRVSSITPTSGAPTGLTVVAIHGSGFSQASAVRFGKVLTRNFVVKSDREIVASSPRGSPGKVVDVTVVSPLGVSVPVSTSRFTYLTHGGSTQPLGLTGPRAAALAASSVQPLTSGGIPIVNGLNPNSGDPNGGTLVTIFGSGFMTATGVSFGTTSCVEFFVEGDNRISAFSPPGTLGQTIDVTVTSLAGSSTMSVADHFTYAAVTIAKPVIYGVTPSQGSAAGGTGVAIFGKGFASATQVKFGSVVAQGLGGRGFFQSDTEVFVTSPPQGSNPAVVDITIVNPAGASVPTTADRFTYTAPALPVINAIDPNHGSSLGQVQVVIYGSGFTGTTSVMFGNAPATTVFVQDDFLSVTAPPQGSNPARVDVTVTTPVGTSVISNADAFTYGTAGTPQVEGLDINRGPTTGGSRVQVFGSGFLGATSVKVGTAAAGFMVFDDNDLEFTSPPGTAGQTLDVTVTTPAGTSGTGVADQFTYAVPARPVIYGISPNHGFPSGQQSVSIYGTGFTGATGVSFGTTSATGMQVLDDGTIVVTSPAQGANPATVDVAVTTPGGTSAPTLVDRFTYGAPGVPAVYGLDPNRGPSLGGTSVAIFGTGFKNGSPGVTFGGVAATFVFASSDGELFATSPAGTTGTTVDVIVTTPAGSSSPGATDKFSYYTAPAPTVTAVSPNGGPAGGGTTVYISGSGFRALGPSSVPVVDFGTNPASSVIALADNLVKATSPAGTVGTVDITVTSAAGTSAKVTADSFTYNSSVPPVPGVTGVGPSSGPATGGTNLYISGQGFTGATAVRFGTVTAGFSVMDDGLIQVFGTPPGAAGPVDVTVTAPGGTSPTSAADTFTYTPAPTPTVAVLSPNAGLPAGGTTVYITGTGLQNLQTVNFGTTAASFAFANSDTLITATSPAGTDGTTTDVTVVTGGGTSATNANDKFTWSSTTPPPSGPTVNGITTNHGPTTGFTSVTILGSGFTGATAVTFGTVPATSFFIGGDTQIFANAPPGSAGTVDVTVTAGGTASATSAADRYTYVAPGPPAVDAVDPNHGTSFGGSTVTIYGRGLFGATAVRFGTVQATQFFAFSDSQIVATSPAGTSSVTVDVTVTTPAGTSPAVGADHFTYVTPGQPVVDAIAPNTGLASGSTLFGEGTSIYGRNLTGASQVLFGSVAASLSGLGGSDTQLSIGIPAELSGTVDVTVTTPGGTSATSAADRFTYVTPPTPAVSALGPNSGLSTGVNEVFITGTGLSAARAFGFEGLSAVSFGTGCAQNFISLSDNLISVLNPPPGTPNTTVDVTVRTLGGTSAVTPADRYTYTTEPTPVVSAVNPSSGLASGGTDVFITGANFRGATAVNFGTASQPVFFQPDDNLMIALTPPGTAGATVDVTVTSPTGTSATSTADHFSYVAPAAPTVTAVRPSSGIAAGGMPVFITGSGFLSATSVSFGSTAVGQFLFCGGARFGGPLACGWVAFSDTLIETISPPGTAGTVDVTVGNSSGTSPISTADKFTYTATPAPTVSAVSPTSGPSGGGTVVYVSGSNFLFSIAAPTTVKFGTTGAGVFPFSDNLIVIGSAPAEGSNPTTVDVTVATAGGTSATSAADLFTYTATPIPVITAVNPSSGPAGANVYITGTGLHTVQTVSFGTFQATPKSVVRFSDTLLVASSPPGPTTGSTVDVTATSIAGTSTTSGADQFMYTATPVPTVTAVSPAGGPGAGGTAVYVTGTALGSATAVNFGTTPASRFAVISDTLIQVFSPAGTGIVDVTVITAGGTSATSSADKFTYNAPPPAPVVSGLSPSNGPAFGGTSVKISGAYFVAVSAVKFGTAAAGSFTVNSDMQITAISPSGSGTVDVTVTTSSGTSATSNVDKFTFTTPAPPTVTSVLPNSGPASGATPVTIAGTGFTGATGVKFGTASASFSVTNDTQIMATSPAGSGTVDVTVTTPFASSATSSADLFTYLPTPTITSVVPNVGPLAGGTAVTITGTNLAGATALHFGTLTATISTDTSTQITTTSPAASAPGTVDVTVTSAGGPSVATAADQFIYGDTAAQVSSKQYTLTGNDGTTWMDMDPGGGLTLTISPAADATAILTGNADLWTANAGINQDIGIYVSPSTATGHIVAWKESGGFAGTFSPNAAAVQTALPMTAGVTYTVKLQWKTNKPAAGDTIVVGAGPWPGTSLAFSPTRLTARLAAASGVSSVLSNLQYVQTGSDGTTWKDVDSSSATPLTVMVTPATTSLAILSGNVDLWTANAGINQDIAINVAEANATQYPGNIVAWKESGGFAGTYSPNAAFVQTVFPMAGGTTYHLKLQWKTNRATAGSIVIGAGDWPSGSGVFSPSRLTVQLMPMSAVSARVSNLQYTLANSNGDSWSDMDTTSTTPLTMMVTPATNCLAIISGNADLWTTKAGYNQDIGISVSPTSVAGNIVAWKESGGFAGTYSPNAAFVQAAVPLAAGTQYTIKLQWKTNKASNGAVIVVGAGPWPGNTTTFSPTTLTTQLLGCS